MIQRSFKTNKGTELPLLNLRGREYLEVKYRLVWFREDHPEWSIETELANVTDVSAYAKALVKDEKGRIIATSHKFESIQGFPDFIEKAETGAIGRALALIGYGTQFCADELDEGQRIVDAPVQTRGSGQSTDAGNDEAVEAQTEESSSKEPGDYVISFGRKYKGKKLKEVPKKELESYIEWLEGSAQKAGTPISNQVTFLKKAYDRLYSAPAEAANH